MESTNINKKIKLNFKDAKYSTGEEKSIAVSVKRFR